MRRALRHLPFTLLGLLGACEMFGGSSEQGNAVAGGSSDQGNALAIRVLDRSGIAVANARVEVVPAGWMSASMPDSGAYMAFTDSMGNVVLKVASGNYAVQGQEGLLRGLAELGVSGEGERVVKATLRLRATSDVVGVLSVSGVDTLFVPGTRRFGIVNGDGRFRIDSLPSGADVLSTRDGRRILLDSAGWGFVREYRKPMVFGGSARITADSLLPKYVTTLIRPLPLDTVRPSGTFDSWRPDTVYGAGDSIWVFATTRACDALAHDGLAAWSMAESLYVYKRTCADQSGTRVPEGEPVVYRFFLTPKTGIWYVTTLQPFGYTWEIP